VPNAISPASRPASQIGGMPSSQAILLAEKSVEHEAGRWRTSGPVPLPAIDHTSRRCAGPARRSPARPACPSHAPTANGGFTLVGDANGRNIARPDWVRACAGRQHRLPDRFGSCSPARAGGSPAESRNSHDQDRQCWSSTSTVVSGGALIDAHDDRGKLMNPDYQSKGDGTSEILGFVIR